MPGQSPPDSPDSKPAKYPARPNSARMPSAATIAGSASGKANSRSTRPLPGKAGCRDRARATTIAGATESRVDSAACHSVNTATRT